MVDARSYLCARIAGIVYSEAPGYIDFLHHL